MRHLDALGLPGRARGVDDVRQVVQADAGGAAAITAAGIAAMAVVAAGRPGRRHHRGGVVQVERRHRRRRQASAVALLDQHHLRPRVLDQKGQTLGRMGRIERHVDACGLQHRQQADDARRAPAGTDRDPHLGADAQGFEARGQAVCTGNQLAVGQAVAAAGDRHRVRRPRRLQHHPLVHQRRCQGVVRPGVVPLPHQLPAFGLRQHRQGPQRPVRHARQRSQQRLQMAGQAPGPGAIEEVAAVLHRPRHAGGGRRQRHRQLGAGRGGVGDRRGAAQREQHLDQGRHDGAAHRRERRQVGAGRGLAHVVVRLGGAQQLLYPHGQIGEGQPAGRIVAQHQRTAAATAVAGAVRGPVRVAMRQARADRHLVAPRIARQERCQGGEQQRKQRRSRPGRQGVERRRRRRRHGEGDLSGKRRGLRPDDVRNVFCPYLGSGRQGTQETPQVVQPPRRRRAGEPGAVAQDRQRQPVAGSDHQRHRVVGLLVGRHRGDREIGQHPRQRLVQRVVFERHNVIEQRRTRRQLAPGLHLVERRVLEAAQRQLLLLHRRQPIAQRHPRRDPESRRQGVDERSDDRLRAGQVFGAAGDGDAEHHVARCRGARQQQRPRPLDYGVQRQTPPPCHVPQLRAGRGVEQPRVPLGAPPVGGARRRPGAACRDRRRRAETGQAAAPECLRRAQILPLQPGDIVAVRRRAAQRRFAAGGERRIAGEELAQQEPLRPSVGQQVVQAPDELVHAVVQLEQCQAHQRRKGDVETAFAIGFQVARQAFLLGGSRKVAPRFAPHFQVDFAVDDLHRPLQVFPVKAGAQDAVAIGDALPGPHEGADIQPPCQPQAELHDVVARAWGIHAVEQHALLHR
jgi:hypothetical protein